MLRSFDDTIVYFHQIRPFERLETKVREIVVAVVVDGVVDDRLVLFDDVAQFARHERVSFLRVWIFVVCETFHDIRKFFIGVFVKVRDFDSRRKRLVFGFDDARVRRCFGGETVEFRRGDAGENSSYDFLSDDRGIDREPPAKFLKARRDFVKANRLRRTVAFRYKHR